MLSSSPSEGEETEVDAAATSRSTLPRTRVRLEEGDKVSRYVVLREVGAGAMGVVYEAFDPELDRRIALKIIREPAAVEMPQVLAAHRQKVLAEAQAMARLSHPNVVAVHDVGASDDGVFIAMEFVEGLPMHRWFRDHSRTWEEVLDVALAAGRGLQAAHEAGLVHRDFKPHNVLVGKDGVVRVVDFGLARLTSDDLSDATEPAQPGELEAIRQRSLSTQSLSVGGKVVGTPAYMSPEQFMAGAVDARSDQFSFCVSVYEGVYGHSPFAAETYAEMAMQVTAGALRDDEPPGDAPAWVRRALVRGLAVRPDDRYPDMATLLARLDYEARRRSRRTFGLVGGVGLAAAVAGVLVSQSEVEAPPEPCQGLDAEIHEVWNETVQTELSQAFEESGAVFAKATFDSIRIQFDDYVEAWGDARTDACRATRVAADQSEELMDRRVYCLSMHKSALQEAIDLLGAGDSDRIARAQQLAEGLPPVEACGRAEVTARGVLERDLPTDAQQRQAIRELDASIIRAELLSSAGDYTTAATALRENASQAAALGRTERRAWAQKELGLTLYMAGEWGEAEEVLTDAIASAEETGFDRERLEGMTALVPVLSELDRSGEANRVGAFALALLKRIDGSWKDELKIHVALGVTAYNAIEYRQGREHFERALALAEGHEPTSSEAAAHNNYGLLLRDIGEYERALEEFKAGGDYFRVRYGPKHPGVGHALLNAGTTYDLVGDPDKAIEELETVIDLFVEISGENSIDVAAAHDALGIVLDETGRSEEALPHHAKAADILRGRPGSEAELALALDNQGLVLSSLERPEEARESLLESLETWRAAVGDTHPDLMFPMTHLAKVERDLGNDEAAVELLRETLALLEGTQVPVAQIDSVRLTLAETVPDRREALALANECLENLDAFPEIHREARKKRLLAFIESR